MKQFEENEDKTGKTVKESKFHIKKDLIKMNKAKYTKVSIDIPNHKQELKNISKPLT